MNIKKNHISILICHLHYSIVPSWHYYLHCLRKGKRFDKSCSMYLLLSKFIFLFIFLSGRRYSQNKNLHSCWLFLVFNERSGLFQQKCYSKTQIFIDFCPVQHFSANWKVNNWHRATICSNPFQLCSNSEGGIFLYLVLYMINRCIVSTMLYSLHKGISVHITASFFCSLQHFKPLSCSDFWYFKIILYYKNIPPQLHKVAVWILWSSIA